MARHWIVLLAILQPLSPNALHADSTYALFCYILYRNSDIFPKTAGSVVLSSDLMPVVSHRSMGLQWLSVRVDLNSIFAGIVEYYCIC